MSNILAKIDSHSEHLSLQSKMNNNIAHKRLSFRTCNIKNIGFQIFAVGMSFAVMFSNSPSFAQSQNLEGDWTGVITIRPPQQDAVKKYTVLLKLGKLESISQDIGAFFDGAPPNPITYYFHEVLEVRILEGKNSKSMDLSSHGKFHLESTVHPENSMSLSESFLPCNRNFDLEHLKTDTSGNFIEGKVICNSKNNVSASGWSYNDASSGTVTFQRKGSVGSPIKKTQETTQQQNVQPQEIQAPQSSSQNSPVDEIKDKVPGFLRSIFK